MAKVTRHAEKRTRSHLGLPKRAAGKNAERALRDGIRHKDVNGSLRRFVDALYFRNMAGNNTVNRFLHAKKHGRNTKSGTSENDMHQHRAADLASLRCGAIISCWE